MNEKIQNVKSDVLDWFEKNRSYLSEFSVEDRPFELGITASPKAVNASPVGLLLSKFSDDAVISAGQDFCLSDYRYSDAGELIQILEAIKAGQFEEDRSVFMGLTLSSSGRIFSSRGTLHSQEIRLLGLIFLFFKKTQRRSYRPWGQTQE